ncbi:MAG: hypothetical protein KGS45_08700 [Planctomycetes bacterium]|nr:hypothetical protein [Planctomycetota bacterium]
MSFTLAPVLALGSVAVGAICGAAVLIVMLLWIRFKPPIIATGEIAPVMRRGVRWWLTLTTFSVLIALAWVLLRSPINLPRTGIYRFVPLALGLIPLLVVNPLYLWRTLWLRQALRKSAGRLCTHCAYDVSTLAPRGTCPECGNAYDIHQDRPLWGTFLKSVEPAQSTSSTTPPSTPPTRPPS